ncbi:amidohydrolase family protein [Streptomyces alanosinicus]|uniref:Amidohydrolase n=1 Tax=Streptomyces alanosinicus TaxID=68171 RepID=A0A918YJC4_9ACTN|nr:amidohydrolase family protein [Streptomyces alanosinicus]GHE05180.1 amidohydrolase [Streptomyces alanosinicus]
MDFGSVDRRRFLGTAAAGLVAGASGRAAAAVGAPDAPDAQADHAGQVLTYTRMTGGSVTGSRAGGALIAEVQGVLWRVPRDGGQAVRLTDWELEATRPALSPDGRTLAVCGYRGGGFHLWTLRPDGGGLRQVTDGPWDDRGVAWSPDGTRLAFSSERGGDATTGSSYGLWVLDLGDGRPRRVTGGDHEDYDPAWSADGRSLVCVRAAHTPGGGNDGGLSLVRVPLAGGPAEVLRTVTSGRLVCPSVSLSGRIAYVHLTGAGTPGLPADAARLMVDGEVVTADEDLAAAPPCWLSEDELLYAGDGQIRVRSLSGSSVREVPFTARMPVPDPAPRRRRRPLAPQRPAPVRGLHRPALSPDGRSVAFVALNALWLMPVGGTPRRLRQAADTHLLQMPAWAPDGRSVLYCTDQDGLVAVHRHHLDGGADEPLTEGGRLYPALSPDGTRLACQDLTGNLLVRTLATGAEQQLARPLATDGPPGAPTWSPDGRYVAFCDRNRLNQRFREGYNLIRVIDTRTGGERRHLPAEHQSLSDRVASGPVWSPDGRWMALVTESALSLLPVTADGTPAGPARLFTDEPADHPSWSADSGTLLYLCDGRLRRLSLATARAHTLPLRLTAGRAAGDSPEPLRVHAGQLWDGTGAPPRHDVDILITGRRITAVEPHRSRRPGHRTLDASDRTVVPGLFDSHTHPYPATYGARQSLTALAYGITTTACLGSPLYEAVRLREAAAAGELRGPRQLACAELLDGARTAYSMGRAHRTREGVRRTLRRAAALDVDFVKTYVRAPGEVMAEAAEAARALGVPSGSHLCSPGRAAGQSLTTHLQATQRLEFGHATSPLGRIGQDLVEQYADGSFALVITPFTAQILLAADPRLAEDPRVTQLMPPWDVAVVREHARTAPTDAQQRALATEMADYRRLADHGATIALGTDAPLVPVGLSVHLVLRALHAHGFSPAEALHSATSVPARLLGLDADLGTVEAGRIADLTIVEGDPFADFDTLVDIPVVVREGVPHEQGDLTSLHGADRSARAAEHEPPSGMTWLEVAEHFRQGACCHPGTIGE